MQRGRSPLGGESVEGVLAGGVVGGVDHLGDLGDRLLDRLGDALAQGHGRHGAALAAAAHGDVDLVVLDALELGEAAVRSEEHTSELQSLMRISYAVFCLKKKT